MPRCANARCYTVSDRELYIIALVAAFDLRDARHVGHATGGGGVAREIGRHGTRRVAVRCTGLSTASGTSNGEAKEQRMSMGEKGMQATTTQRHWPTGSPLRVLALRTLAAVLAIGLLWPPHLVLAQGAFRGARS